MPCPFLHGCDTVPCPAHGTRVAHSPPGALHPPASTALVRNGCDRYPCHWFGLDLHCTFSRTSSFSRLRVERENEISTCTPPAHVIRDSRVWGYVQGRGCARFRRDKGPYHPITICPNCSTHKPPRTGPQTACLEPLQLILTLPLTLVGPVYMMARAFPDDHCGGPYPHCGGPNPHLRCQDRFRLCTKIDSD